MSDVIKNVNGTVWVFAALLIGMVIVQAVMFLRLALNFNKKNNLLSKQEVSQAAKTGFISVFGPAVSVVVVALSLIAMVGSGATFMRCGVIGAPSWELLMANISSQAAGVEFGSPEFTENIFVLCLFGMTLASAPYFLNTILTLKPMDKAVIKAQKNTAKEKKESFIPTFGNAAMMGIMGYSLLDYFKAVPMVATLAVSGLISYILMKVAKKTGQKWLNEWNMAFAMVGGMAVGQIIATMMA